MSKSKKTEVENKDGDTCGPYWKLDPIRLSEPLAEDETLEKLDILRDYIKGIDYRHAAVIEATPSMIRDVITGKAHMGRVAYALKHFYFMALLEQRKR